MSEASVTPAELRRGFGPIYRRLSRCGKEMSLAAKLVLLNLMERLGQNSRTWPLQATIATDTGLSERSVRDALHELEAASFLTSWRQGQGKPNVYALDIQNLVLWSSRPAARGSSRPAAAAVLNRHHVPIEEPPRKNHQRREISNEISLPEEPSPKRITGALRTELHTLFPEVDEAQEFDRATNHKAYLKAIDKGRYYRNWMTNAERFRRERAGSSRRAAPAGEDEYALPRFRREPAGEDEYALPRFRPEPGGEDEYDLSRLLKDRGTR